MLIFLYVSEHVYLAYIYYSDRSTGASVLFKKKKNQLRCVRQLICVFGVVRMNFAMYNRLKVPLPNLMTELSHALN